MGCLDCFPTQAQCGIIVAYNPPVAGGYSFASSFNLLACHVEIVHFKNYCNFLPDVFFFTFGSRNLCERFLDSLMRINVACRVQLPAHKIILKRLNAGRNAIVQNFSDLSSQTDQ